VLRYLPVILALFWVALGGRVIEAKTLDHAKAPYSFDYPNEWHAETAEWRGVLSTSLYDYSQDDNFRAFRIRVRMEPVKDKASLVQRAEAMAQGLSKGAAFTGVKLQKTEKIQWLGQAALAVQIVYRYAGGREMFTRPDGEERHTKSDPLPMVLSAMITQQNNQILIVSLDVALSQQADRAKPYQNILKTFRFLPAKDK